MPTSSCGNSGGMLACSTQVVSIVEGVWANRDQPLVRSARRRPEERRKKSSRMARLARTWPGSLFRRRVCEVLHLLCQCARQARPGPGGRTVKAGTSYMRGPDKHRAVARRGEGGIGGCWRRWRRWRRWRQAPHRRTAHGGVLMRTAGRSTLASTMACWAMVGDGGRVVARTRPAPLAFHQPDAARGGMIGRQPNARPRRPTASLQRCIQRRRPRGCLRRSIRALLMAHSKLVARVTSFPPAGGVGAVSVDGGWQQPV